MMASRRSIHVQPGFSYDRSAPTNPPDASRGGDRSALDSVFHPNTSASYAPDLNASPYSTVKAPTTPSLMARPGATYGSNAFSVGPLSSAYGTAVPSYSSYAGPSWEPQGRVSPEAYMDDFITSPCLTDYAFEPAPRSSGKARSDGKGHSQRRPSNRDEFDGPHQFLQRPPPEYIAQQERDLPHLPTNLVVQEQDSVLTKVNDRLSQCAFDFVAKYQFPIPLSDSCRPVERPQDREWTEWVYLLKRLATKRRVPARVLYNGQIKQFVTILENSLEMRHAAKHQSRPLKDDRNILQLISAGIQVAKILKDAEAMSYLDRLYVTTEHQIQERSASRFRA
ncbi:hypothetical protein DSL72_008566 [Monilinia vaccinii-corymbosi]|uniref:Uncharacterized protein n=1 Tax=Monilinia vaccinii-corymbosi TaxID=61207 RepID=A0A8A3PPU1_9HELO|nr:hypothetical protein DSL72_008566 [Monilinia vaccinii-corymbosi]